MVYIGELVVLVECVVKWCGVILLILCFVVFVV